VADPLFNLCRFVSETKPSSIPDTVIRQAKRVLLDTYGVILAGSTSPEVQRFAGRMARRLSNETGATCPGRAGDFDPLVAAMLNGMAGSTLEYEEGNSRAMGHPAIQIVPAVTAAAESAGLSGNRLLKGVICGYETACRVSRASCLRSGLHPTGTWGVIGSALGVGALSGRDPEALCDIANIAASYAISPYVKNAFVGKNVSCTFAGMVNHIGLMANLFYDSGFLADPDSFAITFSSLVSERLDPERLMEDLGCGFAVSENYFKPYPTCRFTQPALDALSALLEKEPIAPEQVEEITVYSFKAAVHALSDPPSNTDALRFSIPYLLGVMLTQGRVDMETLKAPVLDDPRVSSIAGKVRLVFDSEYERLRPRSNPARIRLRLKTGREFVEAVMNGRGDPLLPLSGQEIADKFLYLAEPVVGKDAAQRFTDTIRELEHEPDVGPVMALLRTGA
jgi:2-methylcitrate dehydratase PrpD